MAGHSLVVRIGIETFRRSKKKNSAVSAVKIGEGYLKPSNGRRGERRHGDERRGRSVGMGRK